MTKFDDIAGTAIEVIAALEPIAAVAVPASASAFDFGLKVIKGLLAAEPTAKSLVARIKSGDVPTPAELAQFESDYESSYQQLDADLKAASAS